MLSRKNIDVSLWGGGRQQLISWEKKWSVEKKWQVVSVEEVTRQHAILSDWLQNRKWQTKGQGWDLYSFSPNTEVKKISRYKHTHLRLLPEVRAGGPLLGPPLTSSGFINHLSTCASPALSLLCASPVSSEFINWYLPWSSLMYSSCAPLLRLFPPAARQKRLPAAYRLN